MSPAPGRVLPLVLAYQFLAKGAINVLFVTAQTMFLKAAGTQGLPYAYAAMNLLYVALQGAAVRRLSGRSASHLTTASLLFLAVCAGRLLWPFPETVPLVAAFLLLLMVYDLFFNQFLTHYLNDVFPLREAKASLPLVTACGSLAFIVSGLLLRLALTVTGLPTVFAVCVGVFACSIAVFVVLRREVARAAGGEAPSPRPAPADPADAPASGAGALGSLGRLLALAGLLTMFGKYWLDYQYTRAINTACVSAEDLASFIALFTAATDLAILVSLTAGTGRLLKRIPLTLGLAVMPLAVLVASVPAALVGGFAAAVGTQFLFTYLGKSVHLPASALVLGVLPSDRRLRAMGVAGMASAVGSLGASLGLVAFQDRLGTGAAFAVNALVFGLLLLTVGATAGAWRRELDQGVEPEASSGSTPLLLFSSPLLSSSHGAPAVDLVVPDLPVPVPVPRPVDPALARAMSLAAAVAAAPDEAAAAGPLRDLWAWLHAPAPAQRRAAVRALASLQHEAFLPDVVLALDDPEPDVVLAAVEGLGAMPSPEALAALSSFLGRARVDDDVRRAALGSRARVARLAAGEAAQALDGLPADERARAAAWLPGLADDGALRAAARILSVPDAPVRRALGDALRTEGDPGLALALAASFSADPAPSADDLATAARPVPGAPAPWLFGLLASLRRHRALPLHDRLLGGVARRLRAAPGDVTAAERDQLIAAAAARGEDQARLGQACRQVAGSDRFARSLGMEYLERHLDRALADDLIPWLSALGAEGKACTG